MARQGVSVRVMPLDRARGAARSTAPAPIGSLGRLSAMIRAVASLLHSPRPAPCRAGPRRGADGAAGRARRRVPEARPAGGRDRRAALVLGGRARQGRRVRGRRAGNGHRGRRDGGRYRRRQRLLRGAAEPAGRAGRPGVGRGRHARLPRGPGEARGGARQRDGGAGRAARSAPVRRPPSTRRSSSTCTTRSPSPSGCSTISRPRCAPAAGSASWTPTTIPSRHGTPPALLRCELAAAGYRETAFQPLKDGAYLAVFAAPAPDEQPRPETIRPCRDAATPR